MAKAFVNARLFEELSSYILVWLQSALANVVKPFHAVLLRRGVHRGIVFDLVEVVCGICLAFASVIWLGSVGSVIGIAIGVALGSVLGACFALSTFGLSFVVFALVGAVVGCIVGILGGGIIAAYVGLSGVEACILYHPRRYGKHGTDRAHLQIGGEPFILDKVPFCLPRSCGADLTQVCFVLQPEKECVRELWVMFGGNAMLALDWVPFCRSLLTMPGRDDLVRRGVAFLLVDYPGYGANSGHTTPTSVCDASYEAIKTVVARSTDGDHVPRIHLFGHSLGAAAAAQLAARLTNNGCQPGRLVMSAPFLSIPDIALHLINQASAWVLPAPKIFLTVCECFPRRRVSAARLSPVAAICRAIVPHHWGNVSMVKAAAEAGWHIGIIHGAEDRLVPPSMGSELARHAQLAQLVPPSTAWTSCSSPCAEFVEVAYASHNDVVVLGLAEYARLMGFNSPCAAKVKAT